ncbi:MAG TPA: DUF998 domain-containing protein [Amycolatopsis sp.]|nr:DUF998 domain-containing protein [Amycolatopsis sp.]
MNETAARRGDCVDGAAAITRSLLGWGVAAGIFYLVTGITLGLTRTGFDFGRHSLSQLMLGDFGWAQAVNLILSGLMTLAAAVGAGRAMRGSRGATAASVLLGVYGVCLVASAIFPPDPMAGSPEGATANEVSLSGLLHMVFGAIGFLSLAGAAFVVAGWFARRGQPRQALYSRVSGIVVALGFLAGAAFSAGTLGVVLLWIAVVAGWAWLAVTSLRLYRTVPHPDAHRHNGSDPSAVAPSA